MMTNKKNILLLTLIVVIALLVILIIIYVINLQFRLTSTNASKGDVIASSSDRIILTFNQPLKSNLDMSSSNIIVTPSSNIADIYIDGNNLVFLLDDSTALNKMTIDIKSIESTKDKVINNFSKTFKIEYVDYESLSDDEKKRQTSQSDSFENRYPIIKDLPIITNQYIIDYRMPNSNLEENIKLYLIIDTVAVPNDNPAIAIEDLDYINTIKQKAINDLSARGYNPDDYIILQAENTGDSEL